jgi:hypothetical protein
MKIKGENSDLEEAGPTPGSLAKRTDGHGMGEKADSTPRKFTPKANSSKDQGRFSMSQGDFLGPNNSFRRG